MSAKSRVFSFRRVVVVAMLGLIVGAGVLIGSGTNLVPGAFPFAAAQGTPPSTAYLAKGDNGLFELRIYPLKQNLIANTFKFMNNVNTFQKQTGMNIIGHFPDLDNSKYIWMRNYPSHSTLQERYRLTYDSEVWKSGKLRAGVTENGLAGSNVYLATPTKYSKLQHPYAAKPENTMPTPEAKALALIYEASPDGDVPTCGKCITSPLVFEVTLHEVKPGMMDSYAQYMGETVFPAQEAKGVRVFTQLVPYAKVTSLGNGGTFIPEVNTFVSIRLFADEATRKQQEMAVGPEDKMAAQKAGRSGTNTIVYGGHPSFYSQMQR